MTLFSTKLDDELEQIPEWHSLTATEVLDALNSQQQGLSSNEAQRRLELGGPNVLPQSHRRSPIRRFLAQCNNVLIYILIGSAITTLLLQQWVDASVILGVVVINAFIGFLQEGKAEDALLAIKKMLSAQATVVRDGHRVPISAENVVVGDIVMIQSGDKVPADIRLITSKNLQIQEAMLTGESLPVTKSCEAVITDSVLAERSSMAFSSTLVTFGQATGVVVATASNTEIGRISEMLSELDGLTTPLVVQMTMFGRWLTGMILILSIMTMAVGIWIYEYPISDMFIAAVGLAVAAIPEGLPAIMTITLAIGVQSMAKRRAIIRRLPAVETLGAVTVICSDKTGTLTCNEMTVTHVALANNTLFEITGVGYAPHGDFLKDDIEINLADFSELAELTRAAVLCNDAVLTQEDGQWKLQGDPTEGALLTLGLKAGIDHAFEQEAWHRVDVIPFESEHQYMATLHHDHFGHSVSYIKGAPERIFAMCRFQRGHDKDEKFDRSYWQTRMEKMASSGQRVLAIATKLSTTEKNSLIFSDIEQGLTLLGIVGMIDPPREDALEAIQRCYSAGIKVKMITGDHAITAMAIGQKIGVGVNGEVLSGREIETMSDRELQDRVNDVDIYARSSPEHKIRLVEALQATGHIVAMTGDGVNDAPALKRADVGTAMGLNGTEVAKDAAEMVLTDDRFSSIIDAVEQGRTVHDNLKKAILFIMPTSGGEALVILAAILMGHMLPITPVQILWVNMITTVTLSLALAFEPPEINVMNRPPRNPKEPILTKSLVWRIVFVSLIMMMGTFSLFIWQISRGVDIAYARTVAVNTLVFFEIFYLFNSRYISESVINKQGLTDNRHVLLAISVLILFQLGFTYIGFMQTLFGTTAINLEAWGVIVLVASSVLLLVEIEKYIVRNRATLTRYFSNK